MTARQKKFAEYYAQSGNTVQSAIKAGYSEKYAKADACKILDNPSVAEYIRVLSEKAQDERIMTAKERQALLSDIAKDGKNDPADRIRAVDTLNKMTGEYAAKIQAEVKTSEKLSDVFAQIGGEGLDEINTADIEFVREMSTRNDYLMATLNPDDPSLPVYKEFVNRSRPYQKYACDVPAEIMKELTEEPVPNWRYWFFTFRDNLSLTDEDIERKMAAAPKGTKLYKNKILGLRGRATGLVFDLQKRNILTAEQAKAFNYVYFSAGLDTAYSQSSPDTIAFTFVGITADRKCVTLDEEVYNNRDRQVPLTPSDIPKIFTVFLEKNRRTWGFARDVYIDSADQATILECQKFGRLTGSIYNFIPAFKKTKIIDRIHLQSAWLAASDFYILEHCKEYAGELNIYSWKEDNSEPEDGNDHLINSCQYAWLPYRDKIGSVKID